MLKNYEYIIIISLIFISICYSIYYFYKSMYKSKENQSCEKCIDSRNNYKIKTFKI